MMRCKFYWSHCSPGVYQDCSFCPPGCWGLCDIPIQLLRIGRGKSRCLLPYFNCAIKGGGRNNRPEFWVRPTNFRDGCIVRLEDPLSSSFMRAKQKATIPSSHLLRPKCRYFRPIGVFWFYGIGVWGVRFVLGKEKSDLWSRPQVARRRP